MHEYLYLFNHNDSTRDLVLFIRFRSKIIFIVKYFFQKHGPNRVQSNNVFHNDYQANINLVSYHAINTFI